MNGVKNTDPRQGIVAEAHLHTSEGTELKWSLRKDGRKYRWYGIDAAITTARGAAEDAITAYAARAYPGRLVTVRWLG